MHVDEFDIANTVSSKLIDALYIHGYISQMSGQALHDILTDLLVENPDIAVMILSELYDGGK